MEQIKKGIDFRIDPHQYAYKRNRCTTDATSYVVHMALTHLENRDSYVRKSLPTYDTGLPCVNVEIYCVAITATQHKQFYSPLCWLVFYVLLQADSGFGGYHSLIHRKVFVRVVNSFVGYT